MTVERDGRRWACQWSAQNLLHYILEITLAHEVGHHVDEMQRKQKGLMDRTYSESEKFAEHYAIRFLRTTGRLDALLANAGRSAVPGGEVDETT